jgi:hypothetical protein
MEFSLLKVVMDYGFSHGHAGWGLRTLVGGQLQSVVKMKREERTPCFRNREPVQHM